MKTANSEKKPSKLRRMFGSRFKAGSYSAFAAAVVIAIAVLVNLAVQTLPQTAIQLDLTAQSLYTLSDQTKRIAASLDTDVNLYLLALRGNEDDTVSRLLQSYAQPAVRQQRAGGRRRAEPAGQLQRHLCDGLQHELQYLSVRYLHQL